LQSHGVQASNTMLTSVFSLRDCFRARTVLQAEMLALRHQLLILQSSKLDRKLRLNSSDRVLGCDFRDCGLAGETRSSSLELETVILTMFDTPKIAYTSDWGRRHHATGFVRQGRAE